MRDCVQIDDAQAGNIRINDCLESKLLDANTDKTVYILLGEKNSVDKIRQDIKINPLTLGESELKEKDSYSYLGDVIHMDGLSSSVYATIKKIESRTISAIKEVKSIIEDCRMKAVGGT